MSVPQYVYSDTNKAGKRALSFRLKKSANKQCYLTVTHKFCFLVKKSSLDTFGNFVRMATICI